jgi:hypothetical protein
MVADYNRMMGKQVDFLICGTQKGGTTALHQYLQRHPSLFLPNRKELHFFDNESQPWRGDGSLGGFLGYRAYRRWFANAPSGTIAGEATPIYMYWWPCAQRIWHYNRHMRLIVILRNPIDRAYAHWNMEVNRGAECLPFLEAIQQERERCRASAPSQHRVYSYVDRGRYSEQIRRLWQLFGSGQVHIVKHEELLDKPAEVLNAIWEFLNVTPLAFDQPIHVHEGRYAQPMPESVRSHLKQLYQPEIQELERLLDWDCSHWLED